MLKLLSVREKLIDEAVAVEYLAEQTTASTELKYMTEDEWALVVLLALLGEHLTDRDEFDGENDENHGWKP